MDGMWVDIIDPIRLSHPSFTIYVTCFAQWYEYNHICLHCHRSHLVPSDVGSFFHARPKKVQPSTTPRVGSAEAGGAGWGYYYATSVLATVYELQMLLIESNASVVVVVVVVDSVY